MAVVAIIVAVVIMGVFPLWAMANETDKTANVAVQTATTDFTNNVRTTGTLKLQDYENFMSTITATGNSYDAEIEIQVLDDNPKKKVNNGGTVIGDNVYYTEYTTQVIEEISNESRPYKTLKEGDMISVKVKNTNTTIAQQLRNFMYKVTGNSSSAVVAEASGMVTTTGSTMN